MLHASLVQGEGGGPSSIRLRVLSLGAGVQATTLALSTAADHGQLVLWPNECECMCGV